MKQIDRAAGRIISELNEFGREVAAAFRGATVLLPYSKA